MEMTYEEFKESVMAEVANCPKEWRKGQSVFNVIDSLYGVARHVQFSKRVDCFYDDGAIGEFLEASYQVLTDGRDGKE